MKSVVLCGSPRENGDTRALMEAMFETLEGEKRVFWAYKGEIGPCIDCRYCQTHAGCAVKDGFSELDRAIRESRNIIIASPVYFSELTGPLLSLASRFQCYWSQRFFGKREPLEGRRRGAILLAGGGNGAPDKAIQTAQALLHMLNVGRVEEPVMSLLTDRLPAKADQKALSAARELGARLSGGE